MLETFKNHFGVLILLVMFLTLIGAMFHAAHDKEADNGITEALKINLAGVVGAITGLVTGSRPKDTRAGDTMTVDPAAPSGGRRIRFEEDVAPAVPVPGTPAT